MSELKLPLQAIKFAFAINLVLVSFMPVQAHFERQVILAQRPTLNPSGQLNEPIFNAPPPPDDIGQPTNTQGGGRRGCKSEGKEKPLTALVPVSGWALTTAEHPTLWFYVPEPPPLSVEFVLKDNADRTVYKSPVTLSGTPGVVRLSLPSKAAPLEIGKRYHWYFKIHCQPDKPPIYVDGWIKRVLLKPEIKSPLEKATPRQRVALYAANGNWYEALTAAAELHRIDPKDSDWATLLRSVGLDNIASEPMVDCCKPEN